VLKFPRRLAVGMSAEKGRKRMCLIFFRKRSNVHRGPKERGYSEGIGKKGRKKPEVVSLKGKGGRNLDGRRKLPEFLLNPMQARSAETRQKGGGERTRRIQKREGLRKKKKS